MPTRPGSAGDWQPLDTVSSTGPCDVRAIMNERPAGKHTKKIVARFLRLQLKERWGVFDAGGCVGALLAAVSPDSSTDNRRS